MKPPSIPPLFYGTAWKEASTETLTFAAISQGFRGVDTANQRKHYYEAGVGNAIKKAIEAGILTRDELFIQTKFTFLRGQDHRLPYDPQASITDQVAQSFAKSLAHLNVEHLDSYVLHGPTTAQGLADADWEAWHAMEALQGAGKVTYLGVSNVNARQLALLCEKATTRPKFVQNRCYAVSGWDAEVRALCRQYDLRYQGFSLLTANHNVLNAPYVHDLAKKYRITVPQLVFRFAMDVGMIPLTGTTDVAHMQQDLDAVNLTLDQDDRRFMETVALPRL